MLKPGGVLALWGYGRMVLPGEMDAPFQRFYAETVGPYWPPERALIDDGYRSLDFPFAEIEAPAFHIEVAWNLPRLIAYLSTWSAVKRYQDAQGQDPLPALMAELDARVGRCGHGPATAVAAVPAGRPALSPHQKILEQASQIFAHVLQGIVTFRVPAQAFIPAPLATESLDGVMLHAARGEVACHACQV